MRPLGQEPWAPSNAPGSPAPAFASLPARSALLICSRHDIFITNPEPRSDTLLRDGFLHSGPSGRPAQPSRKKQKRKKKKKTPVVILRLTRRARAVSLLPIGDPASAKR